jgi:hypothetical protein
MPRIFQSTEERRLYFKTWFEGEKGIALRRKAVLKSALEKNRFPSSVSIKKYNITQTELQHIIDTMSNQIE